jgi:FtsH-binding integral membrane protein
VTGDQRGRSRYRVRATGGSVAADVGAVLLFVIIGRHVHDHGVNLAGIASTSWPFLAGLAAGWLMVAGRRAPTAPITGVVAWLSCVALGMVLRVVSGQGIAAAFVVVALGFLGAALLGWRALVGLSRRRTRTVV